MPEEKIVQFFIHETVGAAIPHVRPHYVIDDPAFMQALHEAILAGRVEMDRDTIVAIDGVRLDNDPLLENRP